MYDIDYNNIADNLLPRVHRKSKIKKFLYTLLAPMQWLRDNLIDHWYNSSSYYLYYTVDYAVPLSKGSRVRFIDNSVWETLVDGIFPQDNNPTIGQIYDTDGTQLWILIQTDFVGLDERIHYNNQAILFEYLLNRYFNPYNILDKIYIESFNTYSMFYIGERELESNNIQLSDDVVINGISEDDDDNDNVSFTIYVPDLLVSLLGTDYEEMIRNIADKYNYKGLIYTVEEYTT